MFPELIDTKPLRQSGIEVDDPAGGLGREEADGRMVEVVDRVLEFEEDVLLLPPLLRHVGDAPHRQARSAGLRIHRPHVEPIPAPGPLRPVERRVAGGQCPVAIGATDCALA